MVSMFDAEVDDLTSNDEDKEESSSDESIGPVFLSWKNASSTTEDFIKLMTNFTAIEFLSLWNMVADVVKSC